MLEAVGIGKAVDGFMLVEDISLTVARGEVVGILGPASTASMSRHCRCTSGPGAGLAICRRSRR